MPVKENVTHFRTVYFARRPWGPEVTAQICLSRLDGSGTCKAIVYDYSFFFHSDPDPLYYAPGAYSGPSDSMAIVLAGPSAATFGNANKITFMVGVSNMFAYATAIMFVTPPGLLQRLLTNATEAVRRIAGYSSDRSQQTSATQIAYDRRTGQIVARHDAIALPGVRLPAEPHLNRLAANLITDAHAASEHLELISVPPDTFHPDDIKAGRRFRIDLVTKRLESGPPDSAD
jgi:hypothetical protein